MRQDDFLFYSFLVSRQDLLDKPVTVTEKQREWIQLMGNCTQGHQPARTTASGSDRSLEWAGHALVGVADGKWTDARDAIGKSV